MVKTFSGWVKHGKLQFVNEKETELKDFIKKYEGRTMEIEIKPLPRRSNPQNRYYWGCVIPMVLERLADLGNEDLDKELVHDFLKDRFNAKNIIDEDGVVLGQVGGTTTKLNTGEFETYLENIKRFASEYLGIVIPDPGQAAEMFTNK